MGDFSQNLPRILVTGASGFVGRRLVSALTERLPQAVILCLSGPNSESGEPSLDLTDEEATRRVVASFRPDTVVHLAAQSSVGEALQDPELVWRANFDGTRNLAMACRDMGRGAGGRVRFVFASSAEVYGFRFNDGACSETAPLAPRSVYGRTKAACEFFLSDVAGEHLDVISLRLFNHTGPGQDSRFVVPALAGRVARLEKGVEGKVTTGNVHTQRDFTDIRDIIEAYLAVITSERRPVGGFAIYNVGSGLVRSILSILQNLESLHGAPLNPDLDVAMMRPADIPFTIGKFDLFAQHYNWRPKYKFEDTIAEILDFERRRVAL